MMVVVSERVTCCCCMSVMVVMMMSDRMMMSHACSCAVESVAVCVRRMMSNAVDCVHEWWVMSVAHDVACYHDSDDCSCDVAAVDIVDIVGVGCTLSDESECAHHSTATSRVTLLYSCAHYYYCYMSGDEAMMRRCV